jgi:hypothetical protein
MRIIFFFIILYSLTNNLFAITPRFHPFDHMAKQNLDRENEMALLLKTESLSTLVTRFKGHLYHLSGLLPYLSSLSPEEFDIPLYQQKTFNLLMGLIQDDPKRIHQLLNDRLFLQLTKQEVFFELLDQLRKNQPEIYYKIFIQTDKTKNPHITSLIEQFYQLKNYEKVDLQDIPSLVQKLKDDPLLQVTKSDLNRIRHHEGELWREIILQTPDREIIALQVLLDADRIYKIEKWFVERLPQTSKQFTSEHFSLILQILKKHGSQSDVLQELRDNYNHHNPQVRLMIIEEWENLDPRKVTSIDIIDIQFFLESVQGIYGEKIQEKAIKVAAEIIGFRPDFLNTLQSIFPHSSHSLQKEILAVLSNISEQHSLYNQISLFLIKLLVEEDNPTLQLDIIQHLAKMNFPLPEEFVTVLQKIIPKADPITKKRIIHTISSSLTMPAAVQFEMILLTKNDPQVKKILLPHKNHFYLTYWPFLENMPPQDVERMTKVQIDTFFDIIRKDKELAVQSAHFALRLSMSSHHAENLYGYFFFSSSLAQIITETLVRSLTEKETPENVHTLYFILQLIENNIYLNFQKIFKSEADLKKVLYSAGNYRGFLPASFFTLLLETIPLYPHKGSFIHNLFPDTHQRNKFFARLPTKTTNADFQQLSRKSFFRHKEILKNLFNTFIEHEDISKDKVVTLFYFLGNHSPEFDRASAETKMKTKYEPLLGAMNDLNNSIINLEGTLQLSEGISGPASLTSVPTDEEISHDSPIASDMLDDKHKLPPTLAEICARKMIEALNKYLRPK